MKYLVDTNAWIKHLRNSNPNVDIHLQQHPASEIVLCSVVVGELTFGAIRSGPQREAANRALIAGLRTRYASLPFDDDAAEHWARVRAVLAVAGTPIRASDLEIAAIGLAHSLTVVTHNTKDFSRVPGLAIEYWQVP